MQQENASQVILRTCLRFNQIKHFELDTIKILMALPEDEFNTEYATLQHPQLKHAS